MRFFNTAGPVNPKDHYCLDPLKRLDLDELLLLIAQKKYFVLHAPRQTGKTSTLLALMRYLNTAGKHRCLYVNVECAQAARNDVDAGMRAIIWEMASSARDYTGDGTLLPLAKEVCDTHPPYQALIEFLSRWAAMSNVPTVLLMDKTDALVGDTLISVLRQIRSGYPKRPGFFPQSVILCGIRDVRDYRLHSGGEVIAGGSAFNIKAESLRMGDFIGPEIQALLAEHTLETGQIFTKNALELIWDLTQGQPWLTNALAYEVCFNMKENRDRSITITRLMVEQARENLIHRRDTHLDQLTDKLREERIQRVLLPLVTGQGSPNEIPEDDLMYARDLGLLATGNTIAIANPIYREIIPRQLTWTTQQTMVQETSWYLNKDGSLDMNSLMQGFQEFFREHSEHWIERFSWKEAGPQLLLQAFLQRIVNGGGRVEREYGLGRMRVDLLVLWPLSRIKADGETRAHWNGPVQKAVIECKVLHKSLETTIADGLKQTHAYMDRCGTSNGHLVIFDRREDIGWEEKIFCKKEKVERREIQVWGM